MTLDEVLEAETDNKSNGKNVRSNGSRPKGSNGSTNTTNQQLGHYKHIIIGAGPAGLQLGYFFEKAGEDYHILERSPTAGTFFKEQPRHRKLLSINKVNTGYPDADSRLRYDWNSLLNDEEFFFTNFSKEYFPDADVLVEYLEGFADHFDLSISFETTVNKIFKEDQKFRINIKDQGDYTCDRLIVATGLSIPYSPDIQGLELCDQYVDCSIDPADFDDKNILIAGKGNSAFEVADNLIGVARKIQICGPSHVKLAWATHYVGHLRAINNGFLDTYQLKAQNNILDGELTKVEQAEDGKLIAHVYFESRRRTIPFEQDSVILCTGFRFNDEIFDESCPIELTHGGKLPSMTSEWESTSASGLYFAGTIMATRDYRKTMSAFIHGFRHNIEALAKILNNKYGETRWQEDSTLPNTAQEMTAKVIDRISRSPGMFLQPGFLCDVLVPGTSHSRYYEDLPVEYIQDRAPFRDDVYFTITLEYGETQNYDPFALPRGVEVKEDFYIHPIITRHVGNKVVDRFYLPDDLDNDWRNQDYEAGMVNFFSKHLPKPGAMQASLSL